MSINFDKVLNSNSEKEAKVRAILQANLKDYIVTKYYLNKFIRNIKESGGFITATYNINDDIDFNTYQIDNKRIDSTAMFTSTVCIRFFINSDFTISVKHSVDDINCKSRDDRLLVSGANWENYDNSIFPIYNYYEKPSSIFNNFKDDIRNGVYNLKFTDAGKVVRK